MNAHLKESQTELTIELGKTEMTIGDLLTLRERRHYSFRSRSFWKCKCQY